MLGAGTGIPTFGVGVVVFVFVLATGCGSSSGAAGTGVEARLGAATGHPGKGRSFIGRSAAGRLAAAGAVLAGVAFGVSSGGACGKESPSEASRSATNERYPPASAGGAS